MPDPAPVTIAVFPSSNMAPSWHIGSLWRLAEVGGQALRVGDARRSEAPRGGLPGATGLKVTFTDRTVEARHHQHSIGVWPRRRSDEAKAEVLQITGRLADLAEQSLAEADVILTTKRRPDGPRSDA